VGEMKHAIYSNKKTNLCNLSVDFIYKADAQTSLPLPLLGVKIPAGFPSPAEPYIERPLDLNEYLIQHPAATFFIRVSGHSMINAGIHDQDILIVDRSLEPKPNKIVIAVIDGEMTVKRLKKDELGNFFLASENPDYPDIEVKAESDVTIWGVVKTVIHSV